MDAWERFITAASGYLRRGRVAQVRSLVDDRNTVRVLDLGGSMHFWNGVGVLPKNLTLLNISLDGQSRTSGSDVDGVSIELYDGVTIPYPDKYFDLVICHSVIEHVPVGQRRSFVAEMRRVGRTFLMQTPAFEFPVEPHFVAPVVHWLPRPLGRKLAAFGLWALLSPHAKGRLDSYFDEVSLLRRRDVEALFPDCRLSIERFLGLPKSYLVRNT